MDLENVFCCFKIGSLEGPADEFLVPEFEKVRTGAVLIY